jgi:hypothetical protein
MGYHEGMHWLPQEPALDLAGRSPDQEAGTGAAPKDSPAAAQAVSSVSPAIGVLTTNPSLLS